MNDDEPFFTTQEVQRVLSAMARGEFRLGKDNTLRITEAPHEGPPRTEDTRLQRREFALSLCVYCVLLRDLGILPTRGILNNVASSRRIYETEPATFQTRVHRWNGRADPMATLYVTRERGVCVARDPELLQTFTRFVNAYYRQEAFSNDDLTPLPKSELADIDEYDMFPASRSARIAARRAADQQKAREK